MKIKSISLTNYKRFTNLHIQGIPEKARLVVLIGPNGSGKSSLFDAFLHKEHGNKSNYALQGERAGYYIKDETKDNVPSNTNDVWKRIKIDMYSIQPNNNDWKTIFNVRSAYRNESDFEIDGINRVSPLADITRFSRIIDADRSVSDNYRRMAWKRMADLDSEEPAETTFGKYRQESLGELQRVMKELFHNPQLQLQDFGGIQNGGAFRFKKGTATNFLYKNLSGGEKAAFDILLDLFVARNEYKDSIYCIDEPEAHMAMALHGPLLQAILDLLPKESQLWIATHSSGFVRKAYDIMKETQDVTFLDFSAYNFDQDVEMTPCIPSREFWRGVYNVTLDDLSKLIAPETIVICEGNRQKADKGFDAECYNQIFSESHPDTLFISHGGASEVEDSQNLVAILGAIARGIQVHRLIDRDEMTEGGRKEKIAAGIGVLRRREIENYLYDPAVLKTFLRKIGKDNLVDIILKERNDLLQGNLENPDIKSVSGVLFNFIRKTAEHTTLGKTCQEFAKQYLVPALKETPDVLKELEGDIFLWT